MVSQDSVAVPTVATAADANMVGGTQQQVAINALQASINSGGHIILAGADASHLGSKYRRTGQQIWSKIDSFQNVNFLISQPNPMMLPLIGIVSERRFQ